MKKERTHIHTLHNQVLESTIEPRSLNYEGRKNEQKHGGRPPNAGTLNKEITDIPQERNTFQFTDCILDEQKIQITAVMWRKLSTDFIQCVFF